MDLIQTIEQCCPPLAAAPLPAADAETLAKGFKVIADPARLRLLSIIAAQPDGTCCVCDLTAPMALSQPTVSHHLKVLHEAGFLTREKRGTWVYYTVQPRALETLRAALAVA